MCDNIIHIAFNHDCTIGEVEFNAVDYEFSFYGEVDQAIPILTEDGGEDMQAIFRATKKILDTRFLLTTAYVPTWMVDTFRLLQYCNTVECTTYGETFNMERIEVSEAWELPEGDEAMLTIEFTKGEKIVVGTCCGQTIDEILVNALWDYTDVDCFDADNGTITFRDSTGGGGNYEYSIDDGATWQESTDFTSLAPATYTLRVRDKDNTANFRVLGTQVITEPAVLDADIVIHEHCWNTTDDNGRIALGNFSGGSGEYQCSNDNGATWHDLPGGNIFADLEPDTYVIKIRDKNATTCQATIDTLTIRETLYEAYQVGLCDDTRFTWNPAEPSNVNKMWYKLEYYDTVATDWVNIVIAFDTYTFLSTLFDDHTGSISYRLSYREFTYDSWTIMKQKSVIHSCPT